MTETIDLNEFHWLLAIVQSIDVGVVVLDREYRVQVWNTFMENRSGVQPKDAQNRNFFSLFPEIDRQWFSRKVESVATLGTPAFTVWEQRPYLMRFKSYQPITGQEEFMYQNTTLLPLRSPDNRINHICLVIYDVTDVATNRHQIQAANAQLQLLSSTDRLTGLYNRGHWEGSLKAAYARHQRYGNALSLVMLDIDHFKHVNDTYGHQAADKVIAARPTAARACSRVRRGRALRRRGVRRGAVGHRPGRRTDFRRTLATGRRALVGAVQRPGHPFHHQPGRGRP